jgi:hypothetical protein
LPRFISTARKKAVRNASAVHTQRAAAQNAVALRQKRKVNKGFGELFLLPNQKNNLRAERPKGRSALILISKIAKHKKRMAAHNISRERDTLRRRKPLAARRGLNSI